jgi:predicted chitinase
MSPTNKETADLIRRVRGAANYIPPQAAMPNGGIRVAPQVSGYDPSVLAKQTQEANDLVSAVAQGGMNLFGATLRLISGLGRGATNLAAGVLPHANTIWDTYKDGFQQGDLEKTATEAISGIADGAWGAIKGIAVSGVPAAADAIQQIDGRPIYEWGSDFFRSADFNHAMKNLKQATNNAGLPGGILDDLSRLNDPKFAEEQVFGGISIPFTPIQNFLPLNRAEAYGLGWDIVVDPTTYATMGIAGAAKGAFRGVSTVTKYNKLGKPANFAEVMPKGLPRPYYAGTKELKKAPITNPTYTVANTSPITYILKEMGRGFTEAHLARRAYLASKTAAIQATHEYNMSIGEGLLGKENLTPQYVEELVTSNLNRALETQKAALAGQGITDPAQIERLVADTEEALRAQAADIIAKAPEIMAALTSKEAAANIARIAEENGITPIEASAMEIANQSARGLRKTVLAVPRTKKPYFNATHASDFGRAIESASDPKNLLGDFGSSWRAFVDNASAATVKSVFESMVMPIGYRVAARNRKAAKESEALTETQNIVNALHDLQLSPMGSKNRKPVEDLKAKDEHIKGTNRTRRVWYSETSAELKHLMRQERLIRETRGGAGSKLTKGRAPTITARQMLQAPIDLLTNLTKNYYEDVVRKTIPNTKPWDELFVNEKSIYTQQLLTDPSLITADIFNKSFGNATIMGERIKYLAERAVSTETDAYRAITDWKKYGYNPLTIQLRHPKLYALAFDAADKSAERPFFLSEAIKLMSTAAGRIQDPVLNKILRRLNITRASLHGADGLLDPTKLEEILLESHTAIMAKKRDQFVARLRAENTGELGADALVDPNQLDATTEALLGQHITDLARKGVINTEEDINLAIEKLGSLHEQQIAAKETLAGMGFDPIGMGAPAFSILTRFESPKAIKATTTEAKTFKDIKAVLVRTGEKSGTAVTPQEAFGQIITSLEEIAGRATTTAAIKAGIDEILTGKIGIKNLSVLPLDPKTLASYFSRIGNIVKQMEDRVNIGAVKGYDAIFTRKGGEYDTQAVIPFLDQAYKASRSQDSLDGGYFAEQIDQMLYKQNKLAKPLHLQTPEEAKKSLESLNGWRGEGISAGLLHTLIRFTEKQAGKVKTVPLSDAMKQDIARAEETLYNDLIDGLIEEEKRLLRVETANSDVVVEGLAFGNMTRVIVESLRNAREKELYKGIVGQRKITIDANGNVQEMLVKLAETIKTAKGKGYQIGLKKPDVFRDGKNIGQISPKEMLPGDQISYSAFLKLSFDLQKITEKNAVVVDVWRAAKQLSQRGIANAEKEAGRAIERLRAEEAAQKVFPPFAEQTRMVSAVEKIADPIKANTNWRARTWLATLTNESDRATRALENLDPNASRLNKLDSKKISTIKKEQESFRKIMNSLKVKYSGFKATPMSKLQGKSIEELAVGNPIDLINYTAALKVTNAEEKDIWDSAMQAILNLTVVGKGSRYSSFSELVQAYKNPKSGLPVPTDQEVLEILVKFGGNVSEKALAYMANPKIERKTVVSLLRKLDQQITKADIADAKAADFLSTAHIAGEAQIRNAMETLPDSEVLQSEMINQMALERVKMHEEGLGWLDLIVTDSLGKEYKQFVVDRFKDHKIQEEYALGKIDVDKPKPNFDRSSMKLSFETTATGLTGWSRIVAGLNEMAKAKGLAEGSAERMQFMTEMTMKALRLQDMHLAISGIFPSISWGLKRRENVIAGLKAFTPQEVQGLSKPVYLTNADILDIFPPDMIANMMFVGRASSMPITSFAPAAKLLVSAMDTLKPGAYFDEAQLIALGSKMSQLMRNDMQYSRVLKGKKGPSHYQLNAEEFEANIRTVVSWMLEPQNSTKLFDQHVANGSYAMKIYKYKSGQVTKPIMEALGKLFQNPFVSTGNKFDAIIKASEEIRNLTGRGDLTDEVLMQADLDLNAVLAAYVDLDSFHVAQEALKMEAAAKSPEGRAILASQRKAAKSGYMQQINAFRLATENARTENGLYVNLAGLRNLKEVTAVPEVAKTDPMDVFGEQNLAEIEISTALQFGDWATSRFAYDYGMETLRPLYGPVERRRVDDVSFFEHIGANMKAKWDKEFPDRNILGEAWQIIQRVPDQVLDTALHARATLRAERINVAQTGQKTLSPEAYAILKKDSNALDDVLNLDDTALNEAVDQLWSLGGRIFAGGDKSLVKRLGLTPQWLNRNLREIGGGTLKASIDENFVFTKLKDGYGFTSAKSMSEIWREWDIANPVEMIITMNSALQRAQVIPKIADDTVKKWGISKDLYKDAAAARRDGLVEIKTVEYPSQGKEFVYFLDTTNHYFPVEIAQELATFSKFLGEVKHIQGTGKVETLLRKWATFTNFTKAMMTIFRPGNYFQNAAGGIWVNSFAGVTSPFAYARGIKAFKASGRNIKDIDETELEKAMTEYEARKGAEGFTIKSANDPRKSTTQLITIKGKTYPFEYSDIEKLATRHGIRVPIAQNREFDLIGEIGSQPNLKAATNVMRKLANKYNKAAYWAGEQAAKRDEWLRLTLFVDELGKHNWTSLESAAATVMKKVDRYHPQVQDLSTSLQKLRPYLMFMTWRNKMMGTVVGDLLNRPGPMLNSVRAIQASNNSQEQSRSRSFGDMTPMSVALPSYFKHNLDPISVDPATGLMTKYSLANPVTDLFGSNGLLSAIDWNSYEPARDQIQQIGMETFDRFTVQSFPYILKAAMNYPQNKLANGGQSFAANGYSSWKDDPLLLNDIMTGVGLNPLHTMAAYTFPWLATGKMAGMTPDQSANEVARAWANFITGMKSAPLDTMANRDKGMQQLLDKIKTIKQMP